MNISNAEQAAKKEDKLSTYLESEAVQIESSTGMILLDLEEVTLVDLDIVQFLARCEAAGMELPHCPAYIREWISRENNRVGRL